MCVDSCLLKNQEDTKSRFETECFNCPAWNECSGCTITRGNVTSACEVPLEHTSADEDGATLETLDID